MVMNNSVSNPYFSAKKLDTLDHGNDRAWLGETTYHSAGIKGQWVARELYHLEHGNVGYERIFFSHDDTEKKYPKRPAWVRGYNEEKTPLFTPINYHFNDLSTATTFIIVGGYADGITVFNAISDQDTAVLAIQGELNTPHLVEQLSEQFPDARIIAALDGDRAGRQAAIRSNCEWITPESGDWNDLYVDQGLCAVTLQLKNILPPLPTFKVWELQRPNLSEIKKPLEVFTKLTDPEDIAAFAMALVLRDRNKIPTQFQRERDYLQHLLAHNFRLSTGTCDQLVEVLYQATKIQKQVAKQLISLPKVHETKHNHIKVRSLKNIEPLVRDGVYLVSGGHGSGKTKNVGIPFIKGSRSKSLAMCHLASLTSDIAERFGIANYQEYKQSLRDVMTYSGQDIHQAITTDNRDSVACCLNSLIGTLDHWVSQCGTLLIDEASAVLMALATGDHIDEPSRKAIYDKLVTTIRKADRVLLMDADLDMATIKFLEFCRPDEEFNIYEMPRQKTNFNIEWAYGASSQDIGTQRLISLLADNKKVIVPTDSQNKAVNLAQVINKALPGKKVLLICQKTRESKEVKDFLKDSNKHARKYDCVIHSPSLRSGVSIEVPHFDTSVAIFTGASITPSDAVQMLRRARNITEWLVCVSDSNLYSMDDATSMGQAQVLASGDHNAELTDFDLFVNSQKAKAATGRNNFAQNLYFQLETYRFNIKHYKSCDEFDRGVLSDAAKANREHYQSLLCNQKPLSSIELESLKSSKNKSLDDLAQLEANEIREFLGVKVITPVEITLWDEGRVQARIKMLNHLISNETPIDETISYSLSQRSFLNVRINAYREILALTNIDLSSETTTGSVSVEQEKAILTYCWENRLLFGYLSVIPAKYTSAKAKMPKDAKKLIRSVLDKVGIKLKSFSSSNRNGNSVVNYRELRIDSVKQNKYQIIAKEECQKCSALPAILLNRNTQSALQIEDITVVNDGWDSVPTMPLSDREVALPRMVKPRVWQSSEVAYVPNRYTM